MRIVRSVVLVLAAVFAPVGAAHAGDSCALAVTDGPEPRMRDCIYVARTGVGLESCPACVCDVDGSGDVQVSDALRCMRNVVGAETSLACPECAGTTTTTTLPGCASCNDVLTGERAYDELCPLSKQIYDDMESCPRTSCFCECRCVFGPCTADCPPQCPTCTGNALACVSCLWSACRYQTEMCREF